MGLNISTHLIVGVPLLNIGEIQEQVETIDLTDALGELTGQRAKLRWIYFTIINRPGLIHLSEQGVLTVGRCLIGSNKHNVSRNYPSERIEYFYDQLLDSEDEMEKWIHYSSIEGKPDQVIIGLKPKSIDGPLVGEYESFSAARLEDIQVLLSEVRKYLKEYFSYDGQVYILSQTHYSY